MKLGLATGYWSAGPPPGIQGTIAEAERLGFDSIWTAEAYGSDAFTPLAWWGSQTTSIKLGTSIAQLSARTPAATAMAAMTLDHLSGGRFILGIGASGPQVVEGWYGQPYPRPLERTREYIQIMRKIFAREEPVTFEGKHYQLKETLNVPQALSKPHPRVLIGGMGEKKTLRLVATYADASNIAGQIGPDGLRKKYEILREHCERERRNYDEIERTVLWIMNPGPNGENAGDMVEQFGRMAEAGAQTIIGSVGGVDNIKPLEAIGRDVIPQVAKL